MDSAARIIQKIYLKKQIIKKAECLNHISDKIDGLGFEKKFLRDMKIYELFRKMLSQISRLNSDECIPEIRLSILIFPFAKSPERFVEGLHGLYIHFSALMCIDSLTKLRTSEWYFGEFIMRLKRFISEFKVWKRIDDDMYINTICEFHDRMKKLQNDRPQEREQIQELIDARIRECTLLFGKEKTEKAINDRPQERIVELVHSAFWKKMEEDLQSGNYDVVITHYEDLRNSILSCIPDRNTKLREQINSSLDIDLISQMIMNKAFSHDDFLLFFNLIKQTIIELHSVADTDEMKIRWKIIDDDIKAIGEISDSFESFVPQAFPKIMKEANLQVDLIKDRIRSFVLSSE